MIEPNSPLGRAYGWATAPLYVLILNSKDLLRMVAAGGPSTLHCLAAVLADPEAQARVLANPFVSAHQLAHHARDALLREVYGDLPQGFQAALAKLGPTIAPRETYRMLLSAFAVPEFLPVLRRRPRISHALVALLATPEARLLNTKLLTRLPLDDTDAVDALREALQLRAHTVPWSEHMEELRNCESPKSLLNWFEYRWEQPFPSPPWPGDDLLQPITDADTLRRVGREMRNCLAEQVVDVGRGAEYYYLTRSASQIAVGLKLRAGKWFATQILEARNRRPKAEARREVLAHLMRAGIAVDIDHETYALLERALEQGDQDDLRFHLRRRLG